MKKDSIEKLDSIMKKIHQCIELAYEENLNDYCEPINDTISGSLAQAKDLIEKYFI